jgi:CRAL/TRIO domain
MNSLPVMCTHWFITFFFHFLKNWMKVRKLVTDVVLCINKIDSDNYPEVKNIAVISFLLSCWVAYFFWKLDLIFQILHKLFIINASSSFRLLWNALKGFIDPRTSEKIQVIRVAFYSSWAYYLVYFVVTKLYLLEWRIFSPHRF